MESGTADKDVPLRGDLLDPQRLEGLLQVGRSLVSELELETVLERVLDAARELTGARYAAMGILDEDKQALERFVHVGIDEETRRAIGDLPRGHGILGELIRHPRPLRLSKISEHPRSYGFPSGHPPMDTFVGAPVMIRGEVYGNLYLTEKEGGGEFSAEDETLLVILSEWAAVAIANARAHSRVQDRRGKLERAVQGLQATVELSRELGATTELKRVLELVAKRGRALVEARIFAVLLIEDGVFRVAEVAGEGRDEVDHHTVGIDDTPAGSVLRAGVAQAISGSAVRAFSSLGIKAKSVLLIPLRARGSDLGVLAAFDHFGDDRGFGPSDELLMSSFAVAAAVAITDTQLIATEKRRLAIAASERERKRWARELHDETLQELGALRVMQETALQIDSVESMRHALIQADEQVRRVIAGLQGLITELRPAALDELGTGAALEALAERVQDRSGIDVDLDLDLAWESGREPDRLEPELESTIYRTVQEALTNVVKHADASEARVAVEEGETQLRILVEDDGKGINGRKGGGGFGLLGMSERIELAGGTLEIEPVERGGTRLTATLPVERR